VAGKKRKQRQKAESGTVVSAARSAQGDKATTKSHRPGLSRFRTCVLFALILAALHAVLWLFSLTGHMKWIYSTAALVSWLLNAMGISNTVDLNIIHLRNDTWNVTSECTAINAVLLFIAFVGAYSSQLRSKVIGLSAGIPVIIAVNILRLVALGWVTEYWPRFAGFFHDYIWESIFVFFIIFLWYLWITMVVQREKISSVPG